MPEVQKAGKQSLEIPRAYYWNKEDISWQKEEAFPEGQCPEIWRI